MVFQLNLAAGRTGFDFIPKAQSGVLHFLDRRHQIINAQHESIPSAGFLFTPIRQRSRPRTTGAAQKNLKSAKRYARKHRTRLVLQLKPEMLCVELDRALNILNLISDSPNVEHDLSSLKRMTIVAQ